MVRLTREEVCSSPKYSLWTRLKWLTEPWTQEVPQSVEFCEFECRRPRCTAESLETCDLRLAHRDSRP